MSHPALTADSTALITGGGSGIGLAAGKAFATMGMAVIVVDQVEDRLEAAEEALSQAGAREVMTSATDVSDRDAMATLANAVAERFGGIDILMNNAGVGRRSSCLTAADVWDLTLGINLGGAFNGCQAFGPGMVARGRPGMIVNTGSKQGITTPPGNPAYNVSKAALKTYTEALAHELRNTEGCRITAHLLVPGFVFTSMTGQTADGTREKPASAWTAEQTVDFFLESVSKGDFYILCPDNDVPRSLDEKRIAWAVGDIINNRPPLSRWHPDYAEAFKAYIEGDG